MGFRRYYDRYSSDPLVRIVAIAVLAGMGVLLATRFWPGVSSGVNCMNLSLPNISGNNQSLLASNVDPTSLSLELVLDKPSIAQGERLGMELRLINSSIAPLTLFLVPQEIVFRYTGQEVGVVFSVQAINGRVLGEPFNVRPQIPVRQRFDQRELRVLGPRARCNLRIEIDARRLAASGLGPGEYRIIAVYRNQFKGTLPPVSALTPTPIFSDQGVWTGEVRSNEVFLTVTQPIAPSQ